MINSHLKYYAVKEYQGFTIVEVAKGQTCIYYEFAKMIEGKLRYSSENFATAELAEKFIDKIVESTEKILNLNQSNTVCQECGKHYDLYLQSVNCKIDKFQSLEIEQRCPNCNHHFFKFNYVLN